MVVSRRGHDGNDVLEHEVIGGQPSRLSDGFALRWTVPDNDVPIRSIEKFLDLHDSGAQPPG